VAKHQELVLIAEIDAPASLRGLRGAGSIYFMLRKKTGGAKVAATPLRLMPRFSLADLQELSAHPQVRVADRRLRQAFESMTGWNMNAST
jgi:hypothetical protein